MFYCLELVFFEPELDFLLEVFGEADFLEAFAIGFFVTFELGLEDFPFD